MKARYSYPLLFLLPSTMIASLAAVVATAAGAGLLWIFMYGDDPWPKSADALLIAVAGAVFVLGFATLMALSYSFGKRQEAAGGLRRTHVVTAVGLSVVIPLLVLLHQWQVGNLGSESVPTNNSPKPTLLRSTA